MQQIRWGIADGPLPFYTREDLVVLRAETLTTDRKMRPHTQTFELDHVSNLCHFYVLFSMIK